MRPSILTHVAALALTSLAASSATAQTIYEPVRVQHGAANTYYYGGCDPQVHAGANAIRNRAGTFGRVNGFAFVSSRRIVVRERTRVYSDVFGPGVNAAIYGYTISDAVNDANARLPQYFTKKQLLESAELQPDGTRVVRADALAKCERVEVQIHPAPRGVGGLNPVGPRKGYIIIIPTPRKNATPAPATQPGVVPSTASAE